VFRDGKTVAADMVIACRPLITLPLLRVTRELLLETATYVVEQ